MAVNFIAIPSGYPDGIDTTTRKTVVTGQLLPYNSANALIQITAFSITSNVVTFTAANALTAGGSDAIFVAGFEGALAYLNGGYTTTSATATTIVAALTHANVALTSALGLATLAPNYATSGLALGGFYSLSGKATGIGTIGPRSYPTNLSVFSLLGTRQYPVNLQPQPALILDYTLAGVQATNAAAVPADSIGFRAEYNKNAY